jgi:hypothetical protein
VEAIFIFAAGGAAKIDRAHFPLVSFVDGAPACARELAQRGRIPVAAVAEIERAAAGATG